MDLNEVLLRSGLLGQAEMVLQRKLAEQPEDAKTRELLGEIYRKQGDLDAAAALYQQLHDCDPTHPTAAYLHAVLTGNPLPVRETAVLPWPAPFVCIGNFLPKTDRDHLFDIIRAQQKAFQPAQLYGFSADHKLIAYSDTTHRDQLWLRGSEEVIAVVETQVRNLLPSLLPRLGVEPFAIGNMPFAVVLSHDGHYSKPHQDDCFGANKVSCVYYIHQLPKVFSGGDLLLYDTHMTRRAYNPKQFTRLPPEDNTLVVFPSVYFHEVTRVTCPSDAFDDGRFVVTAGVGAAASEASG